MLRFGGLEGPELYRSLAELFLAKQHLNLAWWALERAVERGHPAADLLRAGQRGIEKHWQEARKIQRSGPLPPEGGSQRDRPLQRSCLFADLPAGSVAPP